MLVTNILPLTSAGAATENSSDIKAECVNTDEKIDIKIIKERENSPDVRILFMTNTPFTIAICELKYPYEGLEPVKQICI